MTSANRVVFYIGAHQDDWQLFMSPQAYYDLIAPDTTVVLIYTTAGDAGVDPNWRRGRSAGAISSIQFAKRLRIEPATPVLVVANGHPLQCYTIANTRSYYMDLPDGNGNGAGFPATGDQSLQRLYEGGIPEAVALVDDPVYATRYASWADLTTTLRALLEREAAGSAQAEFMVHILDPRVSRHSDHRFTGMAVQDAIGDDPRYQLAMYEEYAITQMAPNIDPLDLVVKSGLYLFYAQTAFEYSGMELQFDEGHLSYVPRQYRTR